MTRDPGEFTPMVQEGLRSDMCAAVDVLVTLHGLDEARAVQVVTAAAIGALLDFYCSAAVSAGMPLPRAQDRIAGAIAETIADQRARSNPANIN